MLSTGLHFASESTSPAPRRDTHTKSCWAHSYFGCSCVTRPLAARGRLVAVTNSVPILTSDASHPLEGLKEDAGMLILPNEFLRGIQSRQDLTWRNYFDANIQSGIFIEAINPFLSG